MFKLIGIYRAICLQWYVSDCHDHLYGIYERCMRAPLYGGVSPVSDESWGRGSGSTGISPGLVPFRNVWGSFEYSAKIKDKEQLLFLRF